jgi:hypothetical protein
MKTRSQLETEETTTTRTPEEKAAPRQATQARPVTLRGGVLLLSLILHVLLGGLSFIILGPVFESFFVFDTQPIVAIIVAGGALLWLLALPLMVLAANRLPASFNWWVVPSIPVAWFMVLLAYIPLAVTVYITLFRIGWLGDV